MRGRSDTWLAPPSPRAWTSGLEELGEVLCAALPGISRRGRVVGRPVVGVEGVARPRINDDLHVGVPGGLHHLAELDRVLGLDAGVLLAVEAEEGDLDVLRDVEARDGIGLIDIGAARRAI